MSSPSCVLCAVYGREAVPRPADRQLTCPRCRMQLEHDMAALRAMFTRAVESGPAAEPDNQARDVLSMLLPMAATPPPSKQPRVSGSRERAVPINVRLLDLLGPARDLEINYPYADDQTGEISIASVLYAWVRRWRDMSFSHQRMPKPRVAPLLAWLEGLRLEILMDADDQIPLFAWQIRSLRRSLQSVLGDTVPYPAVMWGVPCRRCNLISTLVLDLEDPDHYRECTSCGSLMTEEEYKLWLKEIVEGLRATPVDDTAGPSPSASA